ncbi:MAG TPA: hypothetical protein VN903_17720 [Polyangia bacterium]|nr:hypothetical protein [Polyangia bacterium]
MQAYSDPTRESDPHALPDLEVFHMTAADLKAKGWTEEYDAENTSPGWYYWFCFPGCLPDSEPFGPFDTKDEALEDARQAAGDVIAEFGDQTR